MPRKKPDDDELRKRALELRKKGFSLREIGKQIERSSYKAWELVSPYEDHQPKITQVSELNERIAGLNDRLNELTKVTDDLSAQLKKVKKIKDLNEKTSKTDEELENVKEKVKTIDFQLKWGLDRIRLLIKSAVDRASDREFGCKRMDKDGFCTYWIWASKESDWKMKQAPTGGPAGYLLNVMEHPIRCTACPKFEQRGKTV